MAGPDQVRRAARPGHCIGVFNPVSATYRLEHTEKHLVARVLAAWSVSTSLTTAALTALWGVLASLTSPRIAIAAAGVLLLATPLLLPRRPPAARPDLAPEAAGLERQAAA